MLNINRMLFLALKKVQMVKTTSCQIHATQQKIPSYKTSHFPHCLDEDNSPTPYCYLGNPALPAFNEFSKNVLKKIEPHVSVNLYKCVEILLVFSVSAIR